ncbi:MAG: DUF1674 domain-containing protein [Alphaproteobacteria bacterium]|nr:DUF1674 domain-containing protein [Alphaproteobacteria bacterium]MDE2630543.1 DUF1674 domain-containing protein [Alphaproteobacteria bacterium]
MAATERSAKTPARMVKARIAQAGKRALAEAGARRLAAGEAERPPNERGGQTGLEPTRYGDWEKKGIISDF